MLNNKKINVAFIYRPTNNFLTGKHFDNTTYYFWFDALKRNDRIDVTYFPEEKNFDVSKLKGKFDIILLPENHKFSVPDKLENIENSGIPVIARCGDFHYAERYNVFEYHEKYKIDYYFNFMDTSYFYKFFPKNYNYKTIILGLEPSLFQNISPFKERKKDKILITGAYGNSNVISRTINKMINPKRSCWYYYHLRTKCHKLPYVDYTGIAGTRNTNLEQGATANTLLYPNDYCKYLSQYRSVIAATSWFPTIKYWENPAAGCLTFMEITEQNQGKYLGYKDNETAIFINDKNYKNKFEEFLHDPDNPKWERIAKNGRKYAMENLTNDHAVNSLVDLMDELIK